MGGWIELKIAHYSRVRSQILNIIFTFTPLCLSNISRSFEHYTIGVFQELSRFDVISVNYRTGQYTIFERGIDLSPNESLRITAINTRIITSKNVKNVSAIESLHSRVARSWPPKIVYFQSTAEDAWHNCVLRAVLCTRCIVAITPNTLPRLRHCRLAPTSRVHFPQLPFFSLLYHDT